MDTKQTTMMNEMNKKIEDLRLSQTQQTEGIRKELGGEIAEVKATMEKYFANTPPPTRQHEGSSGQTSAEKSNEPYPPDRALGEQSTCREKTSQFNLDQNPNPPLHNSISSRLTKIGFPMFDGSVLREWIYRCEQFFSFDSTLPELKVRLASLLMTDKSLQWHHAYIENRYNIFPLWPEYVNAISERFSELCDDPLSELVSLKQANNSIDIYLEKFDCAITRLTLPPEQALSIFLTNMNQHLTIHVRQFNVTTVPAAAQIAKLHELSLHHTPAKPSRSSFNPYQEKNSSPP